MKKFILLAFVIVTMIGCNDSGGGDETFYVMSIPNTFPAMEGWGEYTTVIEINDSNTAILSRDYTSVTLEQLTAYGNKLKADNFKKYSSESGLNGFVKSTGQQGYGWGYDRYPDGKYLVFWQTDYIHGIPDTIDSWPSEFAFFPTIPANGYSYIQTTKNIVRFYVGITDREFNNYIKALTDKGFVRTTSATGQRGYLFRDSKNIYLFAAQEIPLATNTIHAFQWLVE